MDVSSQPAAKSAAQHAQLARISPDAWQDFVAAHPQSTTFHHCAWLELLSHSAGRMIGSPDCTPGYYNNEGQEMPESAKMNVGYPAGATAYFKYIKEWREKGDFDGIEFN